MTHFLPVLHLMTSALRRRLSIDGEAPAPDPLDHPALRGLGLREIADLPLPRPAGETGADGLGSARTPSQEPDDLRPAA